MWCIVEGLVGDMRTLVMFEDGIGRRTPWLSGEAGLPLKASTATHHTTLRLRGPDRPPSLLALSQAGLLFIRQVLISISL